MTTELEIDKDEFDAFVRETLNLSGDAALTDFQYGVVQDKIASHEVDLMAWLEKRRTAAAEAVKAPKFPKPGEMKNFPPPPSSPQPPKEPAGPANQPAPQANKPAPAPAGKAAPVPAGKPAAKPAAKSVPAPAANRTPGRTGSRHLKQKKGGIGIFSFLLTVGLLLLTVVFAVPAYLPLDAREKIAAAEWMKPLPAETVQWLLFRGQKQESSHSLQYGTPLQALSFSSKKPFRANGTLQLGTPVTDTVEVLLEIVATSGGESFSKSLEFKQGQREVDFECIRPAGDYEVRLTLNSDMSVDKLPTNFSMSIRF